MSDGSSQEALPTHSPEFCPAVRTCLAHGVFQGPRLRHGGRLRPCGFCAGPRPPRLTVRIQGKAIPACVNCKKSRGATRCFPGRAPLFLQKAHRGGVAA